MKITRELLTTNPFSRPGRRLERVDGLVVHYTGKPRQGAGQVRNYFESLKIQTMTDLSRYASAHFVVGLEGEVIQCLPTNEMAYHVGAKLYAPEAVSRFGNYPNSCTIGVELCHPDATGRFTSETRCAAVELFALLARNFGLSPLQDIWTHNGITGKVCPKYFVDDPEAFNRFKLDVDIAVAQAAAGQ